MRAVDIGRLVATCHGHVGADMWVRAPTDLQLMQELMPNVRGRATVLSCSVWVVETMVRLEDGCALVVTHAQLYSLLSPCITNNGGGGSRADFTI